MKERQIQEACCDLLALDGWRRVRTDMPQLRGLGVQELGMADDLFVRYECQTQGPRENGDLFYQARAEVMWVEWKRLIPRKAVGQPVGSKAAQHQKDWHTRERARGALTVIAGVEFEASIDGFKNWYCHRSTLNRRIAV